MAFDEAQFPVDISRDAVSRQKRVTDVVTLRSGYEERNAIWANSRLTFDVGLGIRDLADIYALKEFWEARRGRLRGFRFKDWSDFKSCAPNSTATNTDQTLLSIDTTHYQIQKVYSAASNPWTRTIKKPVNGTVLVRDNTGPLVESVNYTVDYTTGIVTFTLAPTGTPTAGFEFDVPVRFEEETLEISIALVDAGSAPSVKLVELRI